MKKISRTIHGRYIVEHTFPLKDGDGILVGICFDLRTSKRIVIKLSSGVNKLKREAEMNELLDGNAVETTKSLEYVPSSTPGMGSVCFGDGSIAYTFSYMVMPV